MYSFSSTQGSRQTVPKPWNGDSETRSAHHVRNPGTMQVSTSTARRRQQNVSVDKSRQSRDKCRRVVVAYWQSMMVYNHMSDALASPCFRGRQSWMSVEL